MTEFVPGLELSHRFFLEAVRPLVTAHAPKLRYSAALLGSGSEVLGFDTPMSTDHHWGPRVLLFLSREDRPLIPEVQAMLANRLPPQLAGYSTNFTAPNLEDHGTQLLQPTESGPVNHRVDIMTMADFFQQYLGWDMDRPLEAIDWLTFPQQKLATIVAGEVFHDDLDLGRIRSGFEWYPHDVWLYMLACGWERIGQEEHLMGRAGSVGDELGAALIASRLIRDVMRLAFLICRRYAPYPKWLGTAFQQLPCAAVLTPSLRSAQRVGTWFAIQEHLAEAYHQLAVLFNDLQVIPAVPTEPSNFFDRPFKVIWGGRIAAELRKGIRDPAMLPLMSKPPIGSIDQFSDNTDLLEPASWRADIKLLYQ